MELERILTDKLKELIPKNLLTFKPFFHYLHNILFLTFICTMTWVCDKMFDCVYMYVQHLHAVQSEHQNMGVWLQLLQHFGYETLLFYGTFVLTTAVFWTVSHYFNYPVIRVHELFILIPL